MSFFSRPNLDDIQFKQLSGSTLTLSGQTRIATTSGLTLISDGGAYIPIIATGATNNFVLTFDVSEQVIKLKEPTASGGTGIFPYTGLTTCTVGGLNMGSCIYDCQVVDILKDILMPTLQPTSISPSHSFSVNCSPTTPTGYYEIGSSISLTGTSVFNRGTASPWYEAGTGNCLGASTPRSGLPTCHNYTNVNFSGGICNIITTDMTATFIQSYVIGGSSTYTSRVWYSEGDTIYDSSGNPSTIPNNPLPAGCTSNLSRCVRAVYPYFWGNSATVPTINQALVDSGYQCVNISTGDVLVSNYSVTGEYIWVAIPFDGTTSLLKWQGGNSPTNCGSIPGDLFGGEVTATINSPLGCWSAQCYRFYVSNYATSIDYSMTFKRS